MDKRQDHYNPPNPTGFKYPLLTMTVDGQMWYVEIDGQLDLYLSPTPQRQELEKSMCGEQGLRDETLQATATPLLKEVSKRLRVHGHVVTAVGWYGPGSGGPNYVLRNGCIFKRQNHLEYEGADKSPTGWMD